jgi:hypothetical protein
LTTIKILDDLIARHIATARHLPRSLEALELKPGTVKSRLHHALGRLKADLEPGTER